MTMNTAQHAAALAEAILESSASALRQRGENAHAGLVTLSETELVISLEVSRERGNWQRNLVISISRAGGLWETDVKIVGEEQTSVARIGEAQVSSEDLGEVLLAMVRAGLSRLSAEFSAPTPVAASAKWLGAQ